MRGYCITLILLVLITACFSYAADITATLDSSDGSTGFVFRDSGSNEMAEIDSDGNLVIKGGFRLDSAGVKCETAEMLIIDGKLGIGTTNPAGNMQIYNGGSSVGLLIDSGGTGANSQGYLNFITLGDGTKNLGSAGVLGWHLTTRSNTYGSADEQNDCKLMYYDGSTFQDRMFWDHDGNIGVGTNSPTASLEVYVEGIAGGITINNNDNTPVLRFKYNSDLKWHIGAGAGTGNRDQFGIYSDHATALRMNFTESGNVGIGVANPSETLEVSGSIKATGYFKDPNWPAFCAYNNYGGNRSTTGIFPGNVVYFNNGNHYSTATYKFTAPVDGYYHFSWTCYAPVSAGRVFLNKNGGHMCQTESNNKSLAMTLELASGDTVWLNGTAAYPMHWYGANAHNSFSGHLIMAK